VNTGRNAATGLRYISASSTMISSTVATPTITNALLNALSLSTNIATSPVTAMVSVVPPNTGRATSRTFFTASISFGSSPTPCSPTLTSCTFLLGDNACGPVTAPVTRSMPAPSTCRAISPTLAWSSVLSGWSSVRLTTIVALESLDRPNAVLARSSACTDS
jgi:hypothetical protein